MATGMQLPQDEESIDRGQYFFLMLLYSQMLLYCWMLLYSWILFSVIVTKYPGTCKEGQ